MPTLTIDTDRLSALLAQALLGHGTAVDGLAALCGTLGLDPTLWPLSTTTAGRVLRSMGRQFGLHEEALTCGAIHSNTLTAVTAVQAVPYGIEPQVTPDLEAALTAAGVELDAINSLYFDSVHGQTFRQRIRSKAMTFCALVSKGLVREPTAFFVAAVRRNWMLSASYEPGKVKAAGPKATAAHHAEALPEVGSVVQVLGDLGRHCRVVWHRLMGGKWRSLVEDILDGAESVVSTRKLRPVPRG